MTIHNINFMVDFMRKVRESIREGEFEEFKRDFLRRYGGGEA